LGIELQILLKTTSCVHYRAPCTGHYLRLREEAKLLEGGGMEAIDSPKERAEQTAPPANLPMLSICSLLSLGFHLLGVRSFEGKQRRVESKMIFLRLLCFFPVSQEIFAEIWQHESELQRIARLYLHHTVVFGSAGVLAHSMTRLIWRWR
jgi:hypothetical protein